MELTIAEPAPCACPAAGWCARHRMTKVRPQWRLCQTKPYYREHWDREAELKDPEPPSDAEPSPYVRAGLGDVAAALLKKIGIKPCVGCNKRRRALNRVSVPVPARFAPEPLRETTWTDFETTDDWGTPDARWAVGVTTAPRKLPSLLRSLNSLGRAGWTDVRIFAEPCCRLPRIPGITVHEQSKGVFQNWRHALATLRAEKPDAEFYAVFQDDVKYSGNLKEFLERDLWFSDDIGYVSPYRSAGKMIKKHWQPAERYMDRKEGNRERCKPAHGLWGALTYVFPRRSVDLLLADEELKTRSRMIDLGVHTVLASHGLRAWYYSPSLAEHMDGVSSIGHGQGKGMNSGGTFPGESFDCLTLLERAVA